tara:strand:- start:137925 stop:139775 length:1851 start_codon:yes stop_codon:yes gene_type:complete
MRLESIKYTALSMVLISLSTHSYAQELEQPQGINLQREYGVLFNTDQADTFDVSLSQMVDISQTEIPLTIQEHKERASFALKNGLNQTALHHLEAIELDENEYIYSQYGKALALSNLGEFEQSLDILEDIAIEKGSFQEPAKEFSDKLKLTLAEQEFNKKHFASAEQWLEKYTYLNSSRQDNSHIERLRQKISSQNLSSSGFKPNTANLPLKIAFLVPLTGINQEMGQQLLAAAQLALFNNPNPNILLYPQDTQSTETGAIRAAQKAIGDRADIILGPLTSENTKAIMQYTTSSSIPVISFSSNTDIATRYSTTLGYAPEEQATIMAKYAADNGIKSVAILAPNTSYGIRMSEAFQTAIATYDISLSDVALFDETSPDQTKELKQLAKVAQSQKLLDEEFSALQAEYKLVGDAMEDAALERLEELKTASAQPIVDFDALYLPVNANILPLVASQLAYYNMDAENITLLGTAQWQTPSIHNNRAEYIRGAFFPAPPRQSLQNAYNAIETTYNTTPLPLTILAYDGITLLSDLYEESQGNPRFIADLLYKPEGYKLHGGTVRFNKDGTPSRLYSVYEVRSNSSVERIAAPQQFPPTLPEDIDVRERSGIKRFFNPWGF